MRSTSHFRFYAQTRNGLALVITLAFIVLLTILVVSFITFSGLNRSSTESYSKSVQAQEIAFGGLQDILTDLHTEIQAGSYTNQTTYATNGGAMVYIPVSNHAAVPSRAGYAISSWGTDYNTNGGIVSSSTKPDFLSPTLVRVSRRSQDATPTHFSPNFPTNAYFDQTIAAQLVNRASPANTATPSANGRFVSAARWNKTFLLAPTTVTNTAGTFGVRAIPNAFGNVYTPSTGAALANGSTPPYGPPDWVYVTRAGSQALSVSQLTNSLPSNNLTNITIGTGSTAGSPVIGRYAFVMYDEGALLDANVAGYTHQSTNLVSTADPVTGLSQDTIEKSYLSYADLTQIGLTQAFIDNLVAQRNASIGPTTGNNYLTNVLSTYGKNGFLSFTNTSSGSDSPFVNRQDLINYFAKNDPNFNTATALTALPHLGTFSRDANTPSYYPPSDSSGIVNYYNTSSSTQSNGYYNPSGGGTASFGYHTFMDTAGYPNRNLANVRYPTTISAGATVTHYDDNAVAHTYTVNAGTPLLQSRFSLAKINWLSQQWAGQADPGTDNPSYAGSKYPAAIQTCFGLVWDYPAGVSGTEANGGNKCWNYVGSTTAVSSASGLQSVTGVPIETLDQVAAEGREPNFFEMIKAAILNGSLGKSPGVSAWNNGQMGNGGTSTLTATDPYDEHAGDSANPPYADRGPADLFSYSYDGHTTGHAPTSFASYQYSDCQIIQIGLNIIDQFNSGSYPSALYYKYGAEGKFDSVNTGNTANGGPNSPIYGPVNMFYGDKNVPALFGLRNDFCAAPAVSGGNANDTTDWATLSGGGTTNMSYYVQFQLWNPHQQPKTPLFPSGQKYEARAYGSMYGTWSWSGSAQWGPPTGWPTGKHGGQSTISTWYQGNSSTESSTAGTVYFTDASNTSSFYANPYLLTSDSIPTNGAATVSVPQGTSAGQTSPLNVAQPTAPFYNIETANHFAAFYIGDTWPDNSSGSPFLEWYTDPTSVTEPTIVGTNTYTSVTLYGSFIPYNAVGSSSTPIYCNSYALGWVDSNGSFHPYSFMTGVMCQDYASPNADSTGTVDVRNGSVDPSSGSGSEKSDGYLAVDCRTGRFPTVFDSGQVSPIGFNQTMNPSSVNQAFDRPYYNTYTIPYGYGFFQGPLGTNTALAATPDFEVNSVYCSTNQGQSDTVGPPHIFYTDPDGVVRPGDGYYAKLATGDGEQLYGSGTGTGSPTGGTSYALGDKGGNVSHGRRPVILNRPFRSVGELGYVFRDLPFKTLDMFSQSSADAALLDVFSITDESSFGGNKVSAVVAGHVDISNAPVPVLNALLNDSAKKEDFDTNYYMTNEVSTISKNIATLVKPIYAAPFGPLLNRANIVTTMMQGAETFTSATATTTSPSILSAFTSSTDVGNKPYFEAPVRALADVTNTRTWNLMIDVIAQSGHLVPNATSLDNFVVEGERRYWLHVAIDRYTGKIVDQQLEPVYE